jgi:type I restriction enzyme R subunit
VNRVVGVQLSAGSKQSDLYAAIAPVADRVTKRYGAAQARLVDARARKDDAAAKSARDELDALVLFKGDMGAFVRLYTFLSQIFDYGNTDIEKRAIFYKVLIPLLDLGREREGIDLSKVRLTHHNLKGLGKQPMPLGGGEYPKLPPITEAGSGAVQERLRAHLSEIIQKVNDLFQGDLSDQDKLVYVNDVLKGKLMESATLQEQAINNTKQQFANSPDLKSELMKAIMGALDAHNAMSSQALGSEAVRDGLKSVLLDHAGLYESLRELRPPTTP